MTIIETCSDRIFGGYQSAPRISCSDWLFSEDESVYIFSVSDQKTFKVKNASHALCDMNSWGPVFGNCDIYISKNPNTHANNNAKFGENFEAPVDMSQEDKEAYLGGSVKFKVREIEVFEFA